VLDASGKLVIAGLNDLDAHVDPYASAICIPADELVAYQGTTTCVSAGDAGANSFAAFRRHIAPQLHTRLYTEGHFHRRVGARIGRADRHRRRRPR